MSKKDKLQVVNRDLGKAIVAQAAEGFNKDRSDQVLAQVKLIMKNREHSLYWQETNKMAAEFFQKKLDAIEAGAFIISPVNGAILFNDEALRPENFRREDATDDVLRKERIDFIRAESGR